MSFQEILKRLRIDFVNKSSWLISPVQEQKFIEELKAINPDIYINVSNKKGIWRIQDWDISHSFIFANIKLFFIKKPKKIVVMPSGKGYNGFGKTL
ncbi:MAG: hypothetical protein LBL58_10490 [Tannerellaceae bacterium]|jgi:hypothetical protein|nr:hypothetical protein [Tannerellaceae bacterium]